MNCPFQYEGSTSRKRKRPDDDQPQLERGFTYVQPIDNEYEHLDDGDDVAIDHEDEEEETIKQEKQFYKQTIGAQLPTTVDNYDGIEVTPFNMREELAQGEIDKEGNFIPKAEELNEDNNDTWADSIDWTAVEQREKERLEQAKQLDRDTNLEQQSSATNSSPEPKLDKLTCYKKMLRIIRPDETVQKAIRRLGNMVPKRQARGAKSKDSSTTEAINKIAEAKEKLDCLIDMAHKILEEGDMDIYQKSYEQLEELLNEQIT